MEIRDGKNIIKWLRLLPGCNNMCVLCLLLLLFLVVTWQFWDILLSLIDFLHIYVCSCKIYKVNLYPYYCLKKKQKFETQDKILQFINNLEKSTPRIEKGDLNISYGQIKVNVNSSSFKIIKIFQDTNLKTLVFLPFVQLIWADVSLKDARTQVELTTNHV